MISTLVLENQVGDKVVIDVHDAKVVSWSHQSDQQNGFVIPPADQIPTPTFGSIIPYAGLIDPTNHERYFRKSHAKQHNSMVINSGRVEHTAWLWQLAERTERSATLTYWLEDGYHGFPGPIHFRVEFRLDANSSTLKIRHNAKSDRDTLLSPATQLAIPGHFQPSSDAVLSEQNIDQFQEYSINGLEKVRDRAYFGDVLMPNSNNKLQLFSDYPAMLVKHEGNAVSLLPCAFSNAIQCVSASTTFEATVTYKRVDY